MRRSPTRTLPLPRHAHPPATSARNVLFLATSNVSGAIDVAFLDRADVKMYIGPPPARARYDILATVLVELSRAGIVTPGLARRGAAGAAACALPPLLSFDDAERAAAAAAGSAAGPHRAVAAAAAAAAPPPPPGAGAADMLLDSGDGTTSASASAACTSLGAYATGPSAAASVALLRAALASEGLSGRALRKLPLQAHAQSVRSARPVPPEVFCEALVRAVSAEQAARDALHGDALKPMHRPGAAAC